MYYEWGNCFFTLQIFVAELIFLYSYPKRSKFLARIIPGVIAITLLSGFMPSGYTLMRNQYYQFFKYIFMFAVTAAYQCFCFKAKIIAMISACVSGYALQHLSYQAMQLLSLTSLLDIPAISSSWRDRILELMVFPFTYLLTWAAFGRMAAKYEFYKNYDSRFVVVSIFTLFVCLVINRFARQGANLGNTYVIAGNALYAISCCVLSLFISYSLHVLSITRAKNETLERISYEERKQFETSKKNREQLNVKYHDLKHVLSLLDSDRNAEEIAQYRKVLEDFDGEVRTGNETLDIVVNEKADICRSEGISLTFLGDGQLLSFVSQYDIYSMFGNILDNAIEAVRKIDDRGKKIISMTIEAQGNCVIISSMNYFTGKLNVSDGKLVTTKTVNVDSHGYGIRSIKLVAEKYGGEARISAEDDIFDLTVFLTVPEKAAERAEGDAAAKTC